MRRVAGGVDGAGSQRARGRFLAEDFLSILAQKLVFGWGTVFYNRLSITEREYQNTQRSRSGPHGASRIGGCKAVATNREKA
jgi:hypothetical protein